MNSLGTGSGVSKPSTSAIGARLFSFDPPSPVVCFETTFLFSEECCDMPFDFEENFESREVFPVDSPSRGNDDLPLLLLDSGLVGGEASGTISATPLSMEMTLGRDLN
jgi:hypothetical protein